jgi:hypothetical protein
MGNLGAVSVCLFQQLRLSLHAGTSADWDCSHILEYNAWRAGSTGVRRDRDGFVCHAPTSCGTVTSVNLSVQCTRISIQDGYLYR